MSKSIWTVKTFTPRTVDSAGAAFVWTLRKLPDPPDYATAVRFTALHLEAVRQRGLRKGYVNEFVARDGTPVRFREAGTTLSDMWGAAERSGHRYARGKNGPKYLKAGCRLVALWIGNAAGGRLGAASLALREQLYDGDPGVLPLLNDSLQEDGFPPLREWKTNQGDYRGSLRDS